jgi:hypothetical protein
MNLPPSLESISAGERRRAAYRAKPIQSRQLPPSILPDGSPRAPISIVFWVSFSVPDHPKCLPEAPADRGKPPSVFAAVAKQEGSVCRRPAAAAGCREWPAACFRIRRLSPTFCRLQNNGARALTVHPDPAALDRLKTRIRGLRAKTMENGCTEAEALSAAAKVAELLDRYDFSLSDVEIRTAQCEQRHYQSRRKKRIPLDDCIEAVANFCDCRVWREKSQSGNPRYVFFGLPADVEVAHYLAELIDDAVRSELGRYKNSAGYQRFRHQDRHVANASFTLGMIASVAGKLTAMKRERDAGKAGSGRDLFVLKASVVDTELAKLDLTLQTVSVPGVTRMVSPTAYEAGEAVGASLTINPGSCGP